MADEPLYVTFEFRGNLAEEVDRVKLGIAGLRNESARTYQRLIADSDEAFASMSKGNQRLAVSIQEDINSLRQLDAANKALDEGFARGTVTTLQYAEGKAKLACFLYQFTTSKLKMDPHLLSLCFNMHTRGDKFGRVRLF